MRDPRQPSTLTHGADVDCPEVVAGEWKHCKGHQSWDDLDLIADPNMQIELHGFADTFKLYVHHEGRTIIRIC